MKTVVQGVSNDVEVNLDATPDHDTPDNETPDNANALAGRQLGGDNSAPQSEMEDSASM